MDTTTTAEVTEDEVNLPLKRQRKPRVFKDCIAVDDGSDTESPTPKLPIAPKKYSGNETYVIDCFIHYCQKLQVGLCIKRLMKITISNESANRCKCIFTPQP